MKYRKYYTEVERSYRCYRVYFRIVFTSYNGGLNSGFTPIINTGVPAHDYFAFTPKRNIRRNFKEIFRQYRDWNGVDEWR